jgi:hypothetical protein
VPVAAGFVIGALDEVVGEGSTGASELDALTDATLDAALVAALPGDALLAIPDAVTDPVLVSAVDGAPLDGTGSVLGACPLLQATAIQASVVGRMSERAVEKLRRRRVTPEG